MKDLKVIGGLGHGGSVNSVAVSPDGKLIAVGFRDSELRADGWVRLYDVSDDGSVSEHGDAFEGHSSAVNALAFSPDGTKLLSASSDRKVGLWNVTGHYHKRWLEGHTGEVKAVVVTPDGRSALSGALDNTVRMWNLETGACMDAVDVGVSQVCGLALSPDGTRFAAGGSSNKIQLGSLPDWNADGLIEEHSDQVNALAFSPNGTKLLSASDDGTVGVWDLTTGTPRHILINALKGHSGLVRAVVGTPDGRYALSADERLVHMWDIETGDCVGVSPKHAGYVDSLAVHPLGAWAVSAAGTGNKFCVLSLPASADASAGAGASDADGPPSGK